MEYKDKIEELVSDRKKFNETVYTPVSEAVAEIQRRWADKVLRKKIDKLFNSKMLDSLKDQPPSHPVRRTPR